MLKAGVSVPRRHRRRRDLHVAKALDAFLAEEIEETRQEGILFSLHLKATMMKVSDPIIFGHAVKAFLKPVFDKYGEELKSAGVNPNSGIERHARAASTTPATATRSAPRSTR